MAKQLIISAMEEVFGEYIQNMSKENLKIAALRGKIKLENVQLDGDLIAGHVMGPLGLRGLGILSCYAKSLHISVPWKQLEKEPTRFEVRGLHLVCVPLTPATAHRLYGTGSRVDPRCRLRTRVKRLLLARLERHFWNGLLPGEGPPLRRVTRAVRDVERDLKRRRNAGGTASGSRRGPVAADVRTPEEIEIDQALDDLMGDLNTSVAGGAGAGAASAAGTAMTADDFANLELPRDWKVKLREKVLRNMEAAIYDVHIRCEASEGDYSQVGGYNNRRHEPTQPSDGSSDPKTFQTSVLQRDAQKPADEHSFALGITIESFVVRTATETWEVGSHDKRNPVDGSAMSSAKGHLGPNPYVVKNNKIGFFNGVSIYWDDLPPFLLNETDLLQGNYRKLSQDKVLSKIAAAMDAMYRVQDPGSKIRESLGELAIGDGEIRPHDFVCEDLNAEVRVRQSDRTLSGPISCSADVLPFEFTFSVRPNQYIQYNKLKKSVQLQQRFDTMLHQRPTASPSSQPRAWWQYAIACVVARPNSRPWKDVKTIVMNRSRYIELVVKKNKRAYEFNLGYHSGLSEKESVELLALEDLLPMEALEAFHLLALRQVYESQQSASPAIPSVDEPSSAASSEEVQVRQRPKPPGRFRLLSGSTRRRSSAYNELGDSEMVNEPLTPQTISNPMDMVSRSGTAASQTLLDSMTMRLGPKKWYVDWKLHEATINVAFLAAQNDIPLALLTFQASGNVRSFGKGKRDSFIEIIRVDLCHPSAGKVLFLQSSEGCDSQDEDWNSDESVGGDGTVASSISGHSVSSILGPDLVTASRFLALPPPGVVCRIAAGKDFGASKFSVAAHPATLIWTPALFDSVLEFFHVQSSDDFQRDIAQRIHNAATPLARKALLSLLSPASFSLHLNISAPKVYIPVKSRTSDGSLFVDAGIFKLACMKDEGETDVSFDVTAREIRATFIRGKSMPHSGERVSFEHLLCLSERNRRTETTIIHPFHVSVDGRTNSLHERSGYKIAENLPALQGMVRMVDVIVSPLSLNLVDAEVLARAFGKWYARTIHSIRSRNSQHEFRDAGSRRPARNVKKEAFLQNTTPRIISITIDKVEMALEGHSRSQASFTDDKSTVSQDSLYEVAPPTRTYLIEISDILVRQMRQDQLSSTKLSLAGADISRLRDGAGFVPLKGKSKVTDYCILESSKRVDQPSADATTLSTWTDHGDSCILRASFIHDGRICYDEVEVEIESIILRVTPTTLKDCTKGARQVAELAQLVTKELERKVHEEGRKARRRIHGGGSSDSTNAVERAPSPLSENAATAVEHSTGSSHTTRSDSSILFKLTLKDTTLLAGRPMSAIERSTFQRCPSVNFAVLQLLGNALIMFQSIENHDASGSKTLHASVDNVSSLVNTEFEQVLPDMVSPMIGPFAAEFRVVYSTENFGSIVSQNVALDCAGIRSCLTPNDAFIMMNICNKMLERLRAFQSSPKRPGVASITRRESPLASLIRYQKRGTGIATRIDMDIHSISFVLLKAYKSLYGAPEFLDFHLVDLKGKLHGCMSALSGDCSAMLSVKVFNSDVRDWDFVIEPFPALLRIDQMPNEMVLDLFCSQPISMNFTGLLLREIAELRFDFAKDRSKEADNEESILTQSALSTVGLRRAIESRSVRISNHTGLDIHVTADATAFTFKSGAIADGTSISFDIGKINDGAPMVALHLGSAAIGLVGDREPIYNLPVMTPNQKAQLYLLRPSGFYDAMVQNAANLFDGYDQTGERAHSPETILTDGTYGQNLNFIAEPVVEWCMENQRLRPSIIDVYSLDKGRDLLSNSVWSPEDSVHDDKETRHDKNSTRPPGFRIKSNWVKPYLNNDSPEWTDMTCTLRMARERVMLPDSNWMWVHDWMVELSGDCADPDGWEYSADFETFTRARRNYERGDSCRRRRWIRTRIVKPGGIYRRHLRLVWEASEDANGNYSVSVRSHLRCKNRSGNPLSLFLYCPSWEDDTFAGTLQPDEDRYVPIHLASAVYMRIARRCGTKGETLSVRNCSCTERFCILAASYTSDSSIRVAMELADSVSQTTLNFVVRIVSNQGVVDIIIEPVLRLINLLPCKVECQFGELIDSASRIRKSEDTRPLLGKKSGHKRIALRETLEVETGKDSACIALTPRRTPHISLRVPGYEWSPWQRIVNRKANDDTWKPTELEEDYHLHSKEGGELKTRVRLDRVVRGGDPLHLILSVECGHCPTIRVYSQFWIIDKTGFGCRFSEGFSDFLSASPDLETSRRSYLLQTEARQSALKRDMTISGHEWSMGMSGMSMYFSRREKLTLSIETGFKERYTHRSLPKVKSKWVAPLDISNVVPKTIFSVDELNGNRQFDLCISVTVCPGLFNRTKLITLLPRYQVVNLLHREIVVAQDGCTSTATLISSQSVVPFHWEKRSLAPNLRIGAPSAQDKAKGTFQDARCWTVGCFRADRVGITSLRLPTGEGFAKIPLVVQAEVRLASKDQTSAVVIVISVANEKSNPLYLLRNLTPHRILCRQPLYDDRKPAASEEHSNGVLVDDCSNAQAVQGATGFQCSTSEIGPIVRSLLGYNRTDEFVWILNSNAVACFGFDDPEKPHVLEWTCADSGETEFGSRASIVEIDAMGSSSTLVLSNGKRLLCHMRAEHSTKVVEFTEFDPFESIVSKSDNGIKGKEYFSTTSAPTLQQLDDEEEPAFSLRVSLPGLGVSVIDNSNPFLFGREIMLARFDNIAFAFSQTREGYHEIELSLWNFQADNHVQKSVHPVLVFCPRTNSNAAENLLQMSAVRRLQQDSNTFVFRHAAIRLLEIEIFLDRRTAECVAHFIEPLITVKEEETIEATDWLYKLTSSMDQRFSLQERDAPREIEKTIHEANTGRIYFEHLYLHPVRIGLTFTQEWMESHSGSEHQAMMVFQFIRGMASIANAPLFFTSFIVSHVFEAPESLTKIIASHYSSQLTKQIFKLLGSLAILGAPADFINDVGSGVKDFFYEPISAAPLGPKEFIQGLDRGTQSLARGLFVGVVRGTANVTEVVNTNLATLTADEDFIDERKAHQRMLTDAMSRGLAANRSLGDSVGLAGESIIRSVRSGAIGVLEQPTIYASKHGPVGFVKGLGKGLAGAVLKPVVGVGDAAVIVMNHLSDATSKKQVRPKIPKRLRRALPCRSIEKPNCVRLDPYDEKSAKAQKIVTGDESVDDVYLGHLNTPTHLIIASQQCLWAIDRRSRDPWCVNWTEISHFDATEDGVRVIVFSQTGLKPYVFELENKKICAAFKGLLAMQQTKMGNSSEQNSSILSIEPESLSRHHIPGVKVPQVNHIFGSSNQLRKRLDSSVKDEIDLVEQCFTRVRKMGSDSSTFFRALDEEAWSLVCAWGQVFSGLSSRRCIVASLINGTGAPIQVISTKLMEGGSPCYSIPTKEFDTEQGILHPGGVILFFGWGSVPSLLQAGRVFMTIETNAFIGNFSDRKGPDTYVESMPGYHVNFLEKSFDESGWWAKFWLLVRAQK